MSVLERWEPRHLFPDLFDWLDSARPGFSQAIRVEDYSENGTYVIRAELPGMDPDKDVEITVSEDVLHIHAERREETKEPRRSEFRYGSFDRSLVLPAKVKAEDIKASYDKGVLTVRVPMPQDTQKEPKRVPIEK
ncbi:hypothetical protein Acsp03_40220 [Actinomadura sp. NBRC 104412]|uniref:Hsp20/alpha crystallin family protein n=1 Tax=Actinomadura sp. NBRC 104412 TaxID=3032203 RepID=UPI0024A50D52|nr:Hsp20/alpha crystallin family protein [Actinomadura sp. NBRC 104412]GLZ06556.1 hypothetical protein Acsp03_40220 [Actinomadura sp. NBRC 104412]